MQPLGNGQLVLRKTFFISHDNVIATAADGLVMILMMTTTTAATTIKIGSADHENDNELLCL